MRAAASKAGVQLHERSGVRAARRGELVLEDGSSLAFDECLWCTSASAAAWLQQTGLPTDALGFLAINECLQSEGGPAEVFAAGDVASCARHPRPKAGVYAVRQVCVCVGGRGAGRWQAGGRAGGLAAAGACCAAAPGVAGASAWRPAAGSRALRSPGQQRLGFTRGPSCIGAWPARCWHNSPRLLPGQRPAGCSSRLLARTPPAARRAAPCGQLPLRLGPNTPWCGRGPAVAVPCLPYPASPAAGHAAGGQPAPLPVRPAAAALRAPVLGAGADQHGWQARSGHQGLADTAGRLGLGLEGLYRQVGRVGLGGGGG
jgi:hypothetical protein